MESSDEGYYSDIQIIMDFMKLSFIIDDPTIHIVDKNEAFELQRMLLELLQPSQSNRISEIYKRLLMVYEINYDTLERFTNSDKMYNIILFYDSICPHYKKIANIWDEFKMINRGNPNYGLFSFDIRDIIYSEEKNIPLTKKQLKKKELFKRFNIRESPTLVSLNMINGMGRTMRSTITIDRINKFVADCR